MNPQSQRSQTLQLFPVMQGTAAGFISCRGASLWGQASGQIWNVKDSHDTWHSFKPPSVLPRISFLVRCLAQERKLNIYSSPLLPPHAPYIVPVIFSPSRRLKAEAPLSESWIMAATELYQKPEDYSTGEASSTIVKFLSSTVVGVTLYLLSGLTLAATLMALIVVTPAVVLFSPVLVPAGIFVFLVGAGFVLSMVGAIWGLSLLFKYVSKKKNWTEFLFDLGRSLLKKYLKMRFGWIGWLWSLWEWIKWLDEEQI